MSNTPSSIKTKCDLIARTFHLPVFFFNPHGEVLYENMSNHSLNPLYENQTEKFFNPLNFRPSKAFQVPVIRKSVFSEKYILISIYQNDDFIGTVIIGPSLAYPLSEEIVNGIIHDSNAFLS